MAFIYFTEQGSKLLKSGNRLIVEKDGEKIAYIPYRSLNWRCWSVCFFLIVTLKLGLKDLGYEN